MTDVSRPAEFAVECGRMREVTGKECAARFGVSEAQWYKWVKEIV